MVATMGVIASSNIPMILGAMIIGPLSGLVIKRFDKVVANKVPIGFEMLVDNFSMGVMLIVGYYIVGPFVVMLTQITMIGMNMIIARGLLPLTSIFIEPAKVLFLNNAINHGILGPLGIEQIQQSSKSIMFLLEANPGPGFGMLLAYCLFSRDNGKKMAWGAAVINFFGGIHEIYFPYIIKEPMLIIGTILGGMAGISTASPGSILTLIALSPKDEILKTVICVASATIVSFIVSVVLLKILHKNSSLNRVKEVNDMVKLDQLMSEEIKKIVFVCDAGIGSSAMGAASFRRKIRNLNLNIIVENCSVDDVVAGTDLVISHSNLKERCKKSYPESKCVFINNFFDDDKLDMLYEILKNKSINEAHEKENKKGKSELRFIDKESSMLINENIILGLDSESKEEAITRAGRLLVDRGFATEEYIASMKEREMAYSTYIGRGVAIPHGTSEGKERIKKSGVVILQYPKGVNFGLGIVYILIGIASTGEEHLKVMAHIAEMLENEELINRLDTISDKDELLRLFNKEMV